MANDTLTASLQSLSTLLADHPATDLLSERLQTLAERLHNGRFHLAVLGQFKRGKSTLLNALLGEPFLPTGVVPVTAIPTLIAYGPRRQARIIFNQETEHIVGLDELPGYVTEAANPHNVLGVVRVEVQHPAPLLAQGVVLIDTPGIGSTLAHNTATTLDFLAEVDAAFFLVSVDPPLTAVELQFLQAIQQRVDRLFFLLNKVDYLSPAEQQEAICYLEKTLRQQAGLDGDLRLFPVSARLALAARQQSDEAAWVASGMADIEDRLLDFLHSEKQAALAAAIAAKTRDVILEALSLLQTELRALTMPLAELQQKQQTFQAALLAARQQRQQTTDLLQGDRQRMIAHINERAAELRTQAEAHFQEVVVTAVTTNPVAHAEDMARQALADAAEAYFEARYTPFSQTVQAGITAVLTTYAAQADALVDDLRRLAADLFAFDFVPLSPDEPPTRIQEPYWSRSALVHGIGLPVPPGMYERLLPEVKRQQRIIARLQPLAERLALRNAENLRWAVVQNTEQVMRQFQSHLDARWAETIEATGTVIGTAVTRRQQHSEASAAARTHLEEMIQKLQALLPMLPGLQKGTNHEHDDKIYSSP